MFSIFSGDMLEECMQALLPGRVRGHAKSGVECWSEMMVLGSFVTAWHHSSRLHLTSAMAVLPIKPTVKLCIALSSRHFHYFYKTFASRMQPE
jgi:hypothetical protein